MPRVNRGAGEGLVDRVHEKDSALGLWGLHAGFHSLSQDASLLPAEGFTSQNSLERTSLTPL